MPIGGDTEGLNPDLKARLDGLANVCNITVGSGYRSYDEQAALYAKYQAGQGALAAPPGKSNHNAGLAADIDGDKACAHANAPAFGLHFPVAGEDWHVEPVNLNPDQSAYTDPQGAPMAQPKPANSVPRILAAVSSALDPGGGKSSIEQLGEDLGAKPAAPAIEQTAGGGAPGPIAGNSIYEMVLNGIGAPITPENLRLMDAWARAEGMPASANNPFATTEGNTPGVVGQHNSIGVRLYDTPENGAAALVKTLLNGRYEGILSGLRNSNISEAAQGIENSPWGTGGLVRKILGV